MTDQQQPQLNLRWRDYNDNLISTLSALRQNGEFLDVTLCCEDGRLGAHKIVLGATSEVLRELMEATPSSHPLIILPSVTVTELGLLLQFMYTGQVSVPKPDLTNFLQTAKTLQVRGLVGRDCCSIPKLLEPAESCWDEEEEELSLPPAAVPEHQPNSSSILIQALEGHKKRRASNTKEPDPHQQVVVDPIQPPLAATQQPSPAQSPTTRSSSTDDSYDYPLFNLFPPGGGGGPRQQQDTGGGGGSSRVRATDPRPCPKCGKIYRSAHTLRTHLEDKHTSCPGYRCVLCGTVAKSRNSLHSHMSRQHRGISTKDLPVLPMPAPFDPGLAKRLLGKAGGAGAGVSDRCNEDNPNQQQHGTKLDPPPSTGSAILDTYLQFIAENSMALAMGGGGGGNPGFPPGTGGSDDDEDDDEQ